MTSAASRFFFPLSGWRKLVLWEQLSAYPLFGERIFKLETPHLCEQSSSCASERSAEGSMRIARRSAPPRFLFVGLAGVLPHSVPLSPRSQDIKTQRDITTSIETTNPPPRCLAYMSCTWRGGKVAALHGKEQLWRVRSRLHEWMNVVRFSKREKRKPRCPRETKIRLTCSGKYYIIFTVLYPT